MTLPDRDRFIEAAETGGDRERLDPKSIAEVLAGFGISAPDHLRPVELGSRRAPKVVVETAEGKLFLKRRRPGPIEAARFTANLQRRLAAGGCPVPAVRSTADGEAILEHGGHAFELVEFVEGVRYPRHAAASTSAGRTLVRLHEEMRSLAAPDRLRGSYHDSALVREVLGRLQGRGEVGGLATASLVERYEAAAAIVAPWAEARSPRLVHGDFHPGNLIHASDEEGRVLAVLDWEAVRVDLPQVEFAAAAVHFALPRAAVPAGRSGLDAELLRAFARGYGGVRPDTAEVVPDLMIESLVAEIAFLLDGGVAGERADRLGTTVEGLISWIEREHREISRIVQAESGR